MTGLVWVVRKIRHSTESNKIPPVTIFMDHSSLVSISKKSSITSTVPTEKLNLRLVRAGEYLSHFQLDICHKPGKANFVPDALSRLATLEEEKKARATNKSDGELDVFQCTQSASDN
jgi:hypothetical protein